MFGTNYKSNIANSVRFLLLYSHQDEEFKGAGYLGIEVFGAGNGHSVEPLDANNVSWVNPLLPSLNLGPLAAGDLTANAFVFALGFSIVLIVIYIFKRMRILTDTFGKNGKVAYGNQVSTKFNEFLQYSDISNYVG